MNTGSVATTSSRSAVAALRTEAGGVIGVRRRLGPEVHLVLVVLDVDARLEPGRAEGEEQALPLPRG